MKISIIGFGRMGQLIEQCAKDRKVEIVSIIDPYHPGATHKEFSESAMEGVDACICFTQPEVAISNIKDMCKYKKQAVIGTTGWASQMADVKEWVKESGIGLVYSSNFSIGVNIFFKLIEQASSTDDG